MMLSVRIYSCYVCDTYPERGHTTNHFIRNQQAERAQAFAEPDFNAHVDAYVGDWHIHWIQWGIEPYQKYQVLDSRSFLRLYAGY